MEHKDAPRETCNTPANEQITRTEHPSPSGDADAVTSKRAGLHGGALFGQYELLRELGSGGMGTVYLARDTRLGRLVAIKFLTRDNPVLAERFVAEARATARCEHENIVVIHDAGEIRGYSYMVLEYLEGMTLRAWLNEVWPAHRVSTAQVIELITPVVRALVHAHAQGLVHRDLKPENIILTDSGTIKVLDFGIATALDAASAPAAPVREPPRKPDELPDESGLVVHKSGYLGTLAYMSPEQVRGEPVDARTDIWAVGIILWELTTGRRPQQRTSLAQARGNLDQRIGSISEQRSNLGNLADIIDRCLLQRADDRVASASALLSQLQALLPGRVPSSGTGSVEADNPYVGLAAFQEADTTRFCGRGRDVTRLTSLLRNHPLITVTGASGTGKSSVVRAGVIPALKRSGQSWESFIVRPGRQPLAALAELMASSSSLSGHTDADSFDTSTRDQLIASLPTCPGDLGTALRARSRERQCRILLFVDQFEELYTLGADPATRAAFVACLEGVADDASSPLRVVLSLRSDFFDRVAEDRSFTSTVIRGMTLLQPLSRAALRQALTEPLTAVGYAFESDTLVEGMLDSLATTRSPLPLLQFTAARLWAARDRGRRQISQQSYLALGGIEGALATHADAVLAGLSAAEERVARTLFTSLVSEERTRAIVSLDELRASAGRTGGDDMREVVERVVHHLADARLVLMETDSERAATVELVHESLIACWPKLVQWLDEDLEVSYFRKRLRTASRQWQQQGRTEDLLWRGRAAEEAQRWLEHDASRLENLGARDRDYLQAVVSLAVRTRRRHRRLAVAGFTFLGAIAIAISLLAIRSDRQATRADRKAAQAEESARRAADSTRRAEESAAQARNASRMASAREHLFDPTMVLALVREMEPASQLPPRWRELARWALQQDIARVVLSHPDLVNSAAFSSDGTRVVTASFDKIARVWNADGTGEPVLLKGHQERIYSAGFSPDGSRVVTASFDKTARVWNADGTGEPVLLRGHQERVYLASFSPDGTRIVSASADKTARVWNSDGTGEPVVLVGHGNRVYAAAFSPDGTRIVTASADQTARIWTADGTGEPIRLEGHRGRLLAAAFNPDGTHIVTASTDATARIWNSDGRGEILVIAHQKPVHAVAFSPDGSRLVTASADKTVRLWNADGTGEPVLVTGHKELISSASFSPDGTRIITASFDKTTRIWKTDSIDRPVVLAGHREYVSSAAFSADGTRIVTASADKTVRVWSADGTGEPLLLEGHRNMVNSAAFSPDGTRIVTASADKTARVWNADGSGQPVLLAGHDELVNSAAFSPDGTRVVTASFDKTARIWNADGSGQPVLLTGHDALVSSAAFSPDGTQVVTASFDKTARIWNADGTGQPLVLDGHEERVYSAAFSPSGTRVITASFDQTAIVWHLEQRSADGTVAHNQLRGHESVLAASGGRAGDGAFSPDGSRVLTISDDKTLRVWNADGVGEPAILRLPELDAYTAAFSPDGTRIVTASHPERDPNTGTILHSAIVWPSFERFTGFADPALWTATSYCPPVALRIELLGLSRARAATQVQDCRTRVH